MMDDIIKVRELAATNRTCLIDLLKVNHVKVITNATVVSLENSGLHYEKDGVDYGIKCDSIITSIGYIPNEELKEKGYRTICGKVPTKYFEEKFYGLTVTM